MLDGTLAEISDSHFQITFCCNFENVSMNACRVSFGIEDIFTIDPKVKITNPSFAPSTKDANFYFKNTLKFDINKKSDCF